ncbi:unnamed protein product [Mycetohabitans rhizoxinica HKI 454]|uniref:Uncharacterized protein n=1 Tax=Mycetohabitans rhizoxinica (strain DSM 19002 / CIP 109453 / HKI 454) TaxID=882378 RepID=E5APQ9_MYCRK|nr:unnamed protein product [Mycetohabitans rhizoxinica HKI 454]
MFGELAGGYAFNVQLSIDVGEGIDHESAGRLGRTGGRARNGQVWRDPKAALRWVVEGWRRGCAHGAAGRRCSGGGRRLCDEGRPFRQRRHTG